MKLHKEDKFTEAAAILAEVIAIARDRGIDPYDQFGDDLNPFQNCSAYSMVDEEDGGLSDSLWTHYNKQHEAFFHENKLTKLESGNLRDSSFEEYELVVEENDFIEYKPEGMRGKRAYIKTDGENYLEWSGPIKIADKSKFLRGDFEKAKEDSQPIEEAPVQEQEVENIEVKQEKESETSDANLDITARLNKITKLYDDGKLTKEEYQKKSAELISQM